MTVTLGELSLAWTSRVPWEAGLLGVMGLLAFVCWRGVRDVGGDEDAPGAAIVDWWVNRGVAALGIYVVANLATRAIVGVEVESPHLWFALSLIDIAGAGCFVLIISYGGAGIWYFECRAFGKPDKGLAFLRKHLGKVSARPRSNLWFTIGVVCFLIGLQGFKYALFLAPLIVP